MSFEAMENSIPMVVRQILDTIKQIGSTESDVIQVALKSLATILRDGPSVQVKEKDLIYLLEPIWRNLVGKQQSLLFSEPSLPENLWSRRFTT